jgi:hypothetical protein
LARQMLGADERNRGRQRGEDRGRSGHGSCIVARMKRYSSARAPWPPSTEESCVCGR